MTNLDELKNLSPEEKIRKLKEIEEKDKKEIETAQKLIKESESQIEEEKRMKEQIPIPQLKAVDISSLFTPAEKQMYATKRYVRGEEQLEETVQQEQKRIEEMNEKEQFFHELPTEDLYNIQKDYEQVETDLTQEQQDNLYTVQQELYERRQAMENGTYKPTNEVVRDILSLSEGVHRRLYRR